MELNKVYSGVVGDGLNYQFQRPINETFSLYILEIHTAPGIPLSLFVIGSDNVTYFSVTTTESDAFSLCSEGNQTNFHSHNENLANWNFFLTGTPHIGYYNLSILSPQNPQLFLDKPANYSYRTNGIKWFYYENNQTDIPLHFEVTSDDKNSTHTLYVLQTDCLGI
jgi:hypothetical protein